MNLIKFFTASILLLFSSQSLALFMPAGSVQIKTEAATVVNEVGC